MLKKVLGKGKQTHSPREDEPVKKKRSTRSHARGEGGSTQQPPPQAQQDQQQGYVASLVDNYPYLASCQRSWSDRFYREECKK
ncbi:hypothetical protein A2U01_0038378, partial [Trifolium medium]|nr:hypothetical protein [Trifolium medium]